MPTPAVTKAARLHRLAALLESQASSAADLAKHFLVGKRTIHRDLHDLESLGHHVELHGRRYSLRPASTALNAVEALAVHSATRLLVHHTRINEPHYRSALTKLAAQLPDPARRYLLASVDDIGSLSSAGGRTLDQVAQAWFEHRVLRFDYSAPIGSGRAHRNELEVYFFEINPINLAPYVIGYERTYFREVRTFRLDRITGASVLDDAYVIPDTFDPHEVLASAWGIVGGPRLEVKLRVHGRVAHRIHDRPHRNLRVDETTESGDLLVTVTSGYDRHGIPIDLLPWLLGWGAGVEVIGPDHVRDALGRELRAAAAAYAD